MNKFITYLLFILYISNSNFLIFSAELESPANFLTKENLTKCECEKEHKEILPKNNLNYEQPLLEEENSKDISIIEKQFYKDYTNNKRKLALKKVAWHSIVTFTTLSCVSITYYSLKYSNFSVGDYGGAYVMYGSLAPSWYIAKNVANFLLGVDDKSLTILEEQSVKNFVRLHQYPQIQKSIRDNLTLVLENQDSKKLASEKLEFINSLPISYKKLEKNEFFKSNFENLNSIFYDIVSVITSNQYNNNQSALVISGDTGIGKTYAVEKFAKHYNLPLVKPDLTNPYLLFGDEKHAGSLLDAFNALPEEQKGIFPFVLYLEDPEKIINKDLNKQIIQLIDGKFYPPFLRFNIELKSAIVLITTNDDKKFLKDIALKDRCRILKVEGENFRRKNHFYDLK
jgi:hypothetical protein